MNIVFKNIKICNFLSLGSNIEVDLSEQGFVLVKGENHESSIQQSNGSGKSSIFDAIFWTITGETLRGASEVTNEKSTDGCFCDLSLEVENTSYRIIRSKGHSQYGSACYFYENEELLTDQTKKSQEMISKVIPTISSEILGSIVILGQGLPYKFSSLTPSKRKDLLETMSGSSSQIDKVKYQLDQEEVQYTQTVQEINREIMTTKGKISGLETSKEALESQRELTASPETLSESIKLKQSEILEFENLIKVDEEKLKEVKSSLFDFESSLDQLKVFIVQKESEINNCKIKLSQINSGNCPTCGRPYEVSSESLKMKSELENSIQSTTVLVNNLKAKLQGLQSQVNRYKETEREVNGRITSSRYKIDSLNEEISYTNNLLLTAQNLTSQIEDIEKTIKDCRITINDNTKKLEDNQQTLDCIAYLKRQLSRDFKGYMLEEVIKFMSSRSEYYSDFLFSTGKKIEVTLSKNKILITLGKRPYENLSGGERQRVDLVVQFALRDMLMTTSGFSCNLIVLDEAFDNLDAQGSESLIKLVTSELSDINSVFIVTHHSEIAIPYDQQITVTKNSDGISQVEVF